jgi:hypothetical protein
MTNHKISSFLHWRLLWTGFLTLTHTHNLKASDRFNTWSSPTQLERRPSQQNSSEQVPIEEFTQDQDIPARVVTIELQPVSEAQAYEVQIKPVEEKWGEYFTIKTSRSTVRFRATPGMYQVRTRSFDRKERSGPWSSWRNFSIPFHPPANVNPSPGAEIEAKGEAKEIMTFEWPQIRTAKAYRFKLYDEKKKLLRHIITKNTWLRLPLEVGKKYHWSLSPLTDPKETEYSYIEKTYTFSLVKPSGKLTPLAITVVGQEHATLYQFEISRWAEDKKEFETTFCENSSPQFSLKLIPGYYEIRSRYRYQDKLFSPWSNPKSVSIPIPPVSYNRPTDQLQIEATSTKQNKISFSWAPSTWTKKYKLQVLDQKNKLVTELVTEKTEAQVTLPHNSQYKWRVLPSGNSKNYHPNYQENNPENFPTYRFSISEYQKLELSEAEEPSQLYSWIRGIGAETGTVFQFV